MEDTGGNRPGPAEREGPSPAPSRRLRFEDEDTGQDSPSGHDGLKSKSGKFQEDSRKSRPSDRMRQEDEADGPQDTGKAQEPEGSAEKVGSKKGKYQKAQAKAEHTGEKLGKAREKLDKTEAKRAAKKPPGLAKKAVRGARTEAWFYVHNKIHEVEHENVGVEGAHKSELAAEAGARKLTRYAKRRWREHPARKVAKWERKDIKARANVDFQKMASEHPELASNPLSRVQQKWKLKRRYAARALLCSYGAASGHVGPKSFPGAAPRRLRFGHSSTNNRNGGQYGYYQFAGLLPIDNK